MDFIYLPFVFIYNNHETFYIFLLEYNSKNHLYLIVSSPDFTTNRYQTLHKIYFTPKQGRGWKPIPTSYLPTHPMFNHEEISPSEAFLNDSCQKENQAR